MLEVACEMNRRAKGLHGQDDLNHFHHFDGAPQHHLIDLRRCDGSRRRESSEGYKPALFSSAHPKFQTSHASSVNLIRSPTCIGPAMIVRFYLERSSSFVLNRSEK